MGLLKKTLRVGKKALIAFAIKEYRDHYLVNRPNLKRDSIEARIDDDPDSGVQTEALLLISEQLTERNRLEYAQLDEEDKATLAGFAMEDNQAGYEDVDVTRHIESGVGTLSDAVKRRVAGRANSPVLGSDRSAMMNEDGQIRTPNGDYIDPDDPEQMQEAIQEMQRDLFGESGGGLSLDDILGENDGSEPGSSVEIGIDDPDASDDEGDDEDGEGGSMTAGAASQ